MRTEEEIRAARMLAGAVSGKQSAVAVAVLNWVLGEDPVVKLKERADLADKLAADLSQARLLLENATGKIGELNAINNRVVEQREEWRRKAEAPR